MMSATSRGGHDAGFPEPSGETVRRLAVEAGKYLQVDAGQSLPVVEIRRQAEVNGYTNAEIDGLLADAGVDGVDTVSRPHQGELLGDLWKLDESTSGESDHEKRGVSDAVERFRAWLQAKVDDDSIGHSYSRRTANKRYARGKDVDRWFVHEYEVFSTVFVTYCRPRDSEESLVDQAGWFYPRSIVGKRRRILKDLDVHDEYAGVSVLAPKPWQGPDDGLSTHRVPQANAQTHAHDFLWIPGEVSKSDFEGLASLTEADVQVSVVTHRSADVQTPDSVADRGADIDAKRGATTALPHELGNNLPMLQTSLDARGLPAYAERWCAKMRLGPDGSLDTKGIHRVRTHGRFRELADIKKWERLIGEGVCAGFSIRNLCFG